MNNILQQKRIYMQKSKKIKKLNQTFNDFFTKFNSYKKETITYPASVDIDYSSDYKKFRDSYKKAFCKDVKTIYKFYCKKCNLKKIT